ncbi:hypothetical protein [Taklimakanibacter albus]|uniref:Uncharacterized protein n=1 Tax=Taklimakanibacter albus TaxID=2800327 RepID=A0ACC5R179_9HYPH|nr:hypothetical protein [Aestuariivirga sp. YIM B02566]MBK1866380.1 hypothetical protein [Aestuariivirga sp. YIM B02566]
MSRKLNRRTGRSDGVSRFAALPHWMMDTLAWRTMNPVPRAVFIEVVRRYNGSNNGRISLSAREVAKLVNIGRATAADALKELVARGFIQVAAPGGFGQKVSEDGPAGRATRWRLTEHKCDMTGALPTKDFTRWEGEPQAKRAHRKNKTRSAPRAIGGSQGGHSGLQGGRTPFEKAESGPQGGRSEPKTVSEWLSGRTVYKLPGGEPPSTAPAEGERSAPPHGAVASSPVVVDFKNRRPSVPPNGRPAA